MTNGLKIASFYQLELGMLVISWHLNSNKTNYCTPYSLNINCQDLIFEEKNIYIISQIICNATAVTAWEHADIQTGYSDEI